MHIPALSVPAKRTSSWVAETDPKYARAWLESLPLANSAETAREIYQALYTVNRLELAGPCRRELMALYETPAAVVCSGLQTHLLHAAQPLTPKKRQLAEFIRRLQVEMAFGYKWCLRDLMTTRFQWGKDELLLRAAERALYYLREILIRSYQVYMPHPADVWKEMHQVYAFMESRDLCTKPIEVRSNTGVRATTVKDRYVQALLLGVSQPYQLPQAACQQLCVFLEGRGAHAELMPAADVPNPVGHFLVDLTADAPPTPYPREPLPAEHAQLRVLNAMNLVRAAQGFIGRLKKGERVAALQLGFDCREDACTDLLQRMVSAWGLMPRRRYQRMRRNSYLSVCVGLPALHFFAGDQKPFSVPGDEEPVDVLPAFSLDEIAQEPLSGAIGPIERAKHDVLAPTSAAEIPASPPSSFRMDRWHVRDASPQGMLLARYGDASGSVRVGDLVGLHQAGNTHWTAAVVRWLKSPEGQSLELGVETLAVDVTPVAIRCDSEAAVYVHALLLPPTSTPRRPVTLLVPRGTYTAQQSVYLVEPGRPLRQVRPTQLVERTVAYDRIAFTG